MARRYGSPASPPDGGGIVQREPVARYFGAAQRRTSGMIEGGGPGKTLGKYGEAHYIAISPRDEIFVADTLNWRVQKYVRR